MLTRVWSMALALVLCGVASLGYGGAVHAAGVQRFAIPMLGATTGACPQSAPCTLAYALSVAEAGDELILLGSGIAYSLLPPDPALQLMFIDKTLTVQGGWDGSPSGPVVLDPAIYETTLSGSGVRRVITAALEMETLTLQGLTITGGWVSGSEGGGLYLSSLAGTPGTVNLDQVSIAANGDSSDTTYGGGVYASGLTLNISRSDFNGNRAEHGGGGLRLYNSVASITDSHFENNTSTYGSAIEIEGTSPVIIERSVFVRHFSSLSTILISDDGPSLAMTNNYLIHGDGILLDAMAGNLNVSHNTFAGSNSGTGLQAGSSVTGSFRNNILTMLASSIVLGGSPSLVVSNNLFYDNAHNDWLGTNYVTGSPCFVDLLTDEAGYHLTSCSAAIDAGVNAGILEDYDGDSRPRLGGYDIGADEFGWLVYLPLILR
jgi:hypothetical protein